MKNVLRMTVLLVNLAAFLPFSFSAMSSYVMADSPKDVPPLEVTLYTSLISFVPGGGNQDVKCTLVNVSSDEVVIDSQVRDVAGNIIDSTNPFPVQSGFATVVFNDTLGEAYCAFVISGLTRKQALEAVRASGCVWDNGNCIATFEAR